MKLEKFDYQIGNKKTKKEFVALGVLCIALVVVVVLYKTFASFSSNASFSIVGATVGVTEENRVAVMDPVNISKTENDEVYATLYDDGTLSISGTGYMKDFDGNDLIGEVIDAYVAENITFTEEEQSITDFIVGMNNPETLINTGIDLVARRLLTDWEIATTLIDNRTLYNDSVISPYIEFIADDQESGDKVEVFYGMLRKVRASGFNISKIEIVGNVKNIGKYAFNIKEATKDNITKKLHYQMWSSTSGAIPFEEIYGLETFKVDSVIEEVGEKAFYLGSRSGHPSYETATDPLR